MDNFVARIPPHFLATNRSNDAISGNITAQTDQAPVYKAIVALTGNGVNRQVTTTKLGNFYFPVVADGSYIITVSKPNFETVSQSEVEVVEGKPVKVNIALPYDPTLLNIPEEMQNTTEATTESSPLGDRGVTPTTKSSPSGSQEVKNTSSQTKAA